MLNKEDESTISTPAAGSPVAHPESAAWEEEAGLPNSPKRASLEDFTSEKGRVDTKASAEKGGWSFWGRKSKALVRCVAIPPPVLLHSK